MDTSELVSIDLTDEERQMLVLALNEYGGPANGVPLLAPLIGVSTVDEFYRLLNALMTALENKEPLSDLDWARALLLTEISWASDLLGAGIEFATNFRDEKAVQLVRSLQRKISNYDRFELLYREATRQGAVAKQR
jgi:hypothetical protein